MTATIRPQKSPHQVRANRCVRDRGMTDFEPKVRESLLTQTVWAVIMQAA